ncbi:MAG: hypothetical protein IKW28_03645 [Lachnospiraceae bacterium]|nr:hypothetical protein [Lachnospiraceae bacterium]
MKILKSIGLYFVYPLITFILGFLIHMLFVDYFYPNKYDKMEEDSRLLTENMVVVSDSMDKITTCDTLCILEEHDLRTGNITEKTIDLPDKYWGMTRTALEQALEEYQYSPTLEDQEKGFVSLSLDRFSAEEVKITKNYNLTEEHSGYYLMVQDGKIVVMEEDKKTIYLSTDIYAEALSDSLKQELILGKFIHTIDELYGFLESYTS